MHSPDRSQPHPAHQDMLAAHAERPRPAQPASAKPHVEKHEEHAQHHDKHDDHEHHS